jgi:S-adenosylmethionine decarboxylase
MAEGHHQTAGRHILLDVWGVGFDVLNDLAQIRSAMLGAAEAAGATVVDTSFHRFPTQGLSGVVVLSESHISVHTFPEHDYAAFDIFTCGAHVDPERGAEFLLQQLGASRCFARRFQRGGEDGIQEGRPPARAVAS